MASRNQNNNIMSELKFKNIFIEGPILPSFIANRIQEHQNKLSIGAHSIFLGQVRADVVDNKTITGIEYTAYEDMALEKMQVIREEIFKLYPLECMHVYHSLGKILTGEICFFVFCSAAHRESAIHACSVVVDRVKNELPVWGKELFDDQTHQWKMNI